MIIPISSVTAWREGAPEQPSVKMGRRMALWRDGGVYSIAEVCSSSGISLESFLRLWNTHS